MSKLLVMLGVACLLALAPPAMANHDSGLGKSQDHLHRQNGVNGGGVGVPSVTASEPLSLAMVGVGLLAAGLLRRRS
jgi:hypothetical protein